MFICALSLVLDQANMEIGYRREVPSGAQLELVD